jgi:MFS family permease
MNFTPRQRALSLTAIISTSFGVGLSLGIGFPLTALTFEAWHQPKWMIGLAGAVPAIALLIALPIMPRFVTRLGSVAAIVGGCIAGALGFLALYTFESPWAWIVIRLAMSAGFALPWLAGETWINAVAREETRGRVIAIYAMAYFSGYTVGPLMLQALGISGFVPFLASAILTVAASLPIIVGRHLAPAYENDGTHDFISASRMAPVAMVCAFIGGFAEITNLSLIPNVALAGGQSQEEALALLSVLTIGGVLLQVPLGWLSDKTSRFALTVVLAVAYVVLLLVLPWTLTSALLSAVLVFLIGGVILGFYSLGLAIVGERVPTGDLAAANAAFIVMYQVGALLGPLFAGIAMTTSPIAGYVWTTVGLMVVSVALLMVLKRSERPLPTAARGEAPTKIPAPAPTPASAPAPIQTEAPRDRG